MKKKKKDIKGFFRKQIISVRAHVTELSVGPFQQAQGC